MMEGQKGFVTESSAISGWGFFFSASSNLSPASCHHYPTFKVIRLWIGRLALLPISLSPILCFSPTMRLLRGFVLLAMGRVMGWEPPAGEHIEAGSKDASERYSSATSLKINELKNAIWSQGQSTASCASCQVGTHGDGRRSRSDHGLPRTGSLAVG